MNALAERSGLKARSQLEPGYRGYQWHSRRMKYAANRPFADPEKAVRKPLEIANTVAPVDSRIHVENIIGTNFCSAMAAGPSSNNPVAPTKARLGNRG